MSETLTLQMLKPYGLDWYGFTRCTVTRALDKYQESISPGKTAIAQIFTPQQERLAGRLIAKAKRDKVIETCNGRLNSRYYKFIS